MAEIKHKNPKNPLISVVIPAFNEEGFLDKTLESLLNQDFRHFELIVVDNNSRDKTAKIAENFGAKVIFEPRIGVGFARQRGFMEAKGDIIATTDADTILPKNWVSKIIREFRKRKKMVAYGGLFALYSGTSASKIIISRLAYPVWILDRLFCGGWSIPGANFSVKKKAFMAVGGFDEQLTLGEDADISQRLKKVGKVFLDRKFIVLTSGRRFGKGLFPAMKTYIPNAVVRMTVGKNKFTKLIPVRIEEPIKIRKKLFPSMKFVNGTAKKMREKIIFAEKKVVRSIKKGGKKIKVIFLKVKLIANN